VLQGVVYQLDVALESAETQRCGLVFVYDMTGSKYGHFDYELSQKILTLLKVSTDQLFLVLFILELNMCARDFSSLGAHSPHVRCSAQLVARFHPVCI